MPTSVSHGARVSTGTHAYPVRMFARRPCLPGVLGFTWRSYPLVAHAWPDVYARPALVLVWYPCSPDGDVSPNVHAHLRLMLHPMLEGDRSGTYRARTLEINPPWQETCNMHDFGTPDTK